MLNARQTGIVAVLAFGVMVSNGMAQNDRDGKLSPAELFDQRILPIFRSPKPSSCVQCHLAAVDLKNYILPSQEKTFASLRDQGLIDLDQPEKSKILVLIRMGEKDLDKGARLIHQKMRRAEFEAFAAWIKACSRDPRMRALPMLSAAERARPEKPDAVIRHARKSRVVDSFVRNIWSQRMRCFPCHTPHEIDRSNPRHQAAIKTRNKLAEHYPKEVVQRLNIFRKTPEATMKYLIETSLATSKGQLPLINLADPRKSLILIKPTSKLPRKRDDGTFESPSSVEPVTHGGGLKMHPDDQSYKSFIAWIQDYANVVGDRYVSVEDLPADNWYATKLVLKITQAPSAWPNGIPVQLFVYPWNEKAKSWESEPIAFTQGTVTPRRMVNGTLFLLAPKGSQTAKKWDRENASLTGGRYLIKAYVDLRRRLAKDPALMLGEQEFYGQAELNKSRWREGFRQATAISGERLKKE